MSFGLLGSPYFYQYIMDLMLGKGPTVQVISFTDDITAFSEQCRELWAESLKMVKLVINSNIKLNPFKIRWLACQAVTFGLEICHFEYKIADKILFD